MRNCWPWTILRYTPRVRTRPPVPCAYATDPAWFRFMAALAALPTVERAPDHSGETAT